VSLISEIPEKDLDGVLAIIDTAIKEARPGIEKQIAVLKITNGYQRERRQRLMSPFVNLPKNNSNKEQNKNKDKNPT